MAELLAAAPGAVVAVELNLSCPNVISGHRPDPYGSAIFAHDPQLTADVVATVAGAAGRPVWAKLSPNTIRACLVASVARDGGAEAVTCVNTLLGLAL